MRQKESATEAPEGGLVLARLNGGGPMPAVRALRSAMQRRQPARITFLIVLDRNGRLTSIADPKAEILVLGYRRGPSPTR